MATYEVLDHVNHADLKVKIQFGATFENNVNQAIVFPTEFQALQREYPIFFRQAENGDYYAVVVLGLDKDENLYLEGDKWMARYVPAVQMRGPFALELRGANGSGLDEEDPVVRIDIEDPRVNKEDGESLFLPMGGYTPYFEEMLQVLRRIHVGAEVTRDFFGHLQRFDLIEPVSVQTNFDENTRYTIPDVFTISKSKMAELAAEELHELNQLGLLEHCFAVMSSTANMSKLADLKALQGRAA